MAIKSAIMTTAYQTTKTGPNPGEIFGKPFDFGAGHVNPVAALRPGLIFDSQSTDWIRFLCGVGEVPTSSEWYQSECAGPCEESPSTCDPANLNTPSIMIANIPEHQTVKRTVTNVLGEVATFSASSGIVSPPGFAITVSPASFALGPGERRTMDVKITRAGGAFEQFAYGSITWNSSSNASAAVRIPVVVKASLMSAPKELKLDTTRVPRVTYRVTPRFSGRLSAVVLGLQPSRVFQGTVGNDPVMPGNLTAALQAGLVPIKISIPPTMNSNESSKKFPQYVRLALFNSDLGFPVSDYEMPDLDLYVFDTVTGALIGRSFEAEANEEVNIMNPTTSSITVFVHGYWVPTGSVKFKLHVWILNSNGPASSNVLWSPTAKKPAQRKSGSPVDVTLSFAARIVDPKQKWLGVVKYSVDDESDSRVGLSPIDSYYDTFVYVV
jgi:hypothetical protein